MNNYEKHAWQEFRAAGWVDDNNKFQDEMQEAMCQHVIKLLNVFEGEGHSGSSAPYAISLFEKLAKGKRHYASAKSKESSSFTWRRRSA